MVPFGVVIGGDWWEGCDRHRRLGRVRQPPRARAFGARRLLVVPVVDRLLRSLGVVVWRRRLHTMCPVSRWEAHVGKGSSRRQPVWARAHQG